MSKTSKIEWTDTVWEPVGGCRHKSEGCRNCYAETLLGGLSGVASSRFKPIPRRYDGLVALKSGRSRFTGQILMWPDRLVQPLLWRKPRTVFVCSQSDLFFEERSFDHIAAVYAVMAATPHIRYLVLTKRPERRREFFAWLRADQEDIGATMQCCFLDMHAGHKWMTRVQQYAVEHARLPLDNVGEGVSVEDQATADARIPVLLATPAAMRFVSYEPALGPVDFSHYVIATCPACGDPQYPGTLRTVCRECEIDENRQVALLPPVSWIIAGAESGPGARPAPLDWFRSVRDQCAAAGVPYFLKQAAICQACGRLFEGEAIWPCPACGGTGRAGKVRKGCPELDGEVHDARPAWLTGGVQ